MKRGMFSWMMLLCSVAMVHAQQIDFGSQILPIFENNCIGCHGGTNNLFLDSYNNIMKGNSDHGPVVTPGNGNGSVIIQKLRGTASFGSRMPFGGPFLSDATITLIKTWIDQGAKATATGVQDVAGNLPASLALRQNFPNPFNPSTVIEYSVAQVGRTTVRIYDLLGRDIATLVDGQVTPGTHRLTWSAASLPSGQYIVRLESGSSSVTRRMSLIK